MGREAVLRILRAELRLHPRMAGLDLQKLVHQAVYGMDHLTARPHDFAHDLRLEWDALEASSAAQLRPVQVIDPDGRTARLHLAPCKALGTSLDELTDFLQGQPPKCGSQARYEDLWALVCSMARAGEIPFAAPELAALPFSAHPPPHSMQHGPAAYRVVNDVTHPPTAEWLRQRRWWPGR